MAHGVRNKKRTQLGSNSVTEQVPQSEAKKEKKKEHVKGERNLPSISILWVPLNDFALRPPTME